MNEADQDPPPYRFTVSTNKSELDLPWVVRTLQATYFGGWRSEEVILTSIRNSMLCFGLYTEGRHQQVGFARVVGDASTFAWLCDVVMDPEMRRHGFGTQFMHEILKHPHVGKVACRLATRDAFGWYDKFGFKSVKDMRRLPQ